MRASEYIELLTGLMSLHGDLEVVDSNDEPIAEPFWEEYSADSESDAFVLAERA